MKIGRAPTCFSSSRHWCHKLRIPQRHALKRNSKQTKQKRTLLKEHKEKRKTTQQNDTTMKWDTRTTMHQKVPTEQSGEVPECLQACNLSAPGLWCRRAETQFRQYCRVDRILNWCIGPAQTAWHSATRREALPHTNPYYRTLNPVLNEIPQCEHITMIRQLL